MKLLLLFTIILSLHFSLGAKALASIIVDPANREQDIGKDFTIFTKEAQGLTPVIEEKKISSLRFGYFTGEKWAGISLKNTTDQPINRLLYFDTLTGILNLYRQNQNQFIELGRAGSSLPYNKREYKNIYTVFNLTLPAHSEQQYFFKITSRHNFNSNVFLGNEQSLKARQDYKLSFMSFYLGGILCLILYNFFIYLYLRDNNYLYYCFFAGSFLLPILAIHGLLDKFFPSAIFSFSHYLICFSSMALLGATVFTFYFLEIEKFLPRLRKFYKSFMIIAVSLILVGLTPLEDYFPHIFGKLIDASIVIANTIFILSAIKLLHISKLARFYLFSWMVVFISLIFWFGMTFGILPNNFFTQHALLYANLGQMLTLALALAFKIHQLIQDKALAEEKALKKEKYHRLVRVLSHDIANSLTIINSYSKKLLKNQNLDPQFQSKSVEKIYFASENIKNILNNVRQEELLSLRQKELPREKVYIQEVIQNSWKSFEDHLNLKRIELKIDVDADHAIWANKTCFLNNIVNNILSNAIKFSFENSKIEISSSRDSENVYLVFKDYGKGIEPELIHDIFFSNRLISSSGTHAEIGHGFGTILMREYVQLFEGTMQVDSHENEAYTGKVGTQITLKFPLPKSRFID